MALENGLFRLFISDFPTRTSIQFGDFPASHVSLPLREFPGEFSPQSQNGTLRWSWQGNPNWSSELLPSDSLEEKLSQEILRVLARASHGDSVDICGEKSSTDRLWMTGDTVIHLDLPSGKPVHNYGKSLLFMGKFIISSAILILSIAMFDITRG